MRKKRLFYHEDVHCTPQSSKTIFAQRKVTLRHISSKRQDTFCLALRVRV